MDQALNSQKTPHTSPLRASYGMSFVSILMKNDRVIKGFYCNYQNQCWPGISKVQQHSSQSNFMRDSSAINPKKWHKNYQSKFSLESLPTGQRVIITFSAEINITKHMHIIGHTVSIQTHWNIAFRRVATKCRGKMVFTESLAALAAADLPFLPPAFSRKIPRRRW